MTKTAVQRGLCVAFLWAMVAACGRTPIGANGVGGDSDPFTDELFGDGDRGDGDRGDGDRGDGDFGDGDFGDGDFGDGDDGFIPQPPQRQCGNGVVNPGEQCDGFNLNGNSCRTFGFSNGSVSCNRRTCQVDTSNCWNPDNNLERFFACSRQTAPFVNGSECAGRLCACNLNATENCGPDCWDLLRCVTRRCGGNGDDISCIIDNCDVSAANEATAMRGCLESSVDVCGLLDPPPPPPTLCGNGILERGEACDRTDLGGLTCNSFDLVGTLRCDRNCRLRFDRCIDPPDSCGNGIREPGEECDPGAPFSLSCSAFNLAGGAVGCTSSCRYDLSRCRPRQPCGNGVIEPGERCDGMNLGGQSCATFGLDGDGLTCNARCQLDPSNCEPPPVCGDEVAERGEECDGMDLLGQTCEDFGFAGGSLSCTPACDLNLSACESCGDGAIGPSERCDGNNLDGQSCRSLGYTGGALSCDGACQFDTTRCALCGNGAIEPGEGCDGMELNGQTCTTLGLGDGALACDVQSCLYDTSLCDTNADVCGNGVTEPGEQCDGMDLASNTCETLGYDEGSLSCNTTTCRFDVSQCRDIPDPPDPNSCPVCSQEACADPIQLCEQDESCINGLRCLAANCSNNSTDLSCVVQCFGNPNGAFAALSLFSCMVSSCGVECVGSL